jgi:SAM-dependent methyltransferase
MSGAAHAEQSVDEAVEGISSLFEIYKATAGVKRFHGRFAEVGPGDSCGIGLMFLADGCEHVELVDRFFSMRDERHQRSINCAIVQRLPGLTKLLLNGDFSESSFAHLSRHYGEAAAAETFFAANKDYDFIVSNAVLEHVYDPLRALSAMASALNVNGMMLHRVDCRDHGQFSEHFHELKFLELPLILYSSLKWRGGPNRIRLSSYVNLLRQLQLEFTIYVDALAGVQEFMPVRTVLRQVPEPILNTSRKYVASVRKNLAKPFRDTCDEDLMVTRFTIVAKKVEASVVS